MESQLKNKIRSTKCRLTILIKKSKDEDISSNRLKTILIDIEKLYQDIQTL